MLKRIMLIAALFLCCVVFLFSLLFQSSSRVVIEAQSDTLEKSSYAAQARQIYYSDIWEFGKVTARSESNGEGISIGIESSTELFSSSLVPEYRIVGTSPFTVEVISLRLMLQKSGEYTGALNIDAQVIGQDGSYKRQTSSGSVDVVSQSEREWIKLPLSDIEGATIVYPDEFLVARVTRDGAPVSGLSFYFTMQAGVSSPSSELFLPTIRQ